jgi:hypothetical protein
MGTTVLQETAVNLIETEKKEAYGPLRESFTRIAKVWSAVLKTEITPEQACLCMIGLKLCRESNKHGEDNIIDLYGYTACYERLLKD